MATKVLSIEIGQGLTRVVEMDYKAKTPKIYNRFTFVTPKNVMMDGVIGNMDTFVSVMKTECENHGVRTNKVVFSVASSRIASREVNLPLVKGDSKIQEMLNINATDFFPVDMAQYHLAYKVLNKTTSGKEKKMDLQVLAVPNEITDSHLAFATACGFTVLAMDYVGNSVVQLMKEHIKEGVHAIVKIDEQSSMLTILKDGRTAFQRTTNYGINGAIEVAYRNPVFGTNLTYGEAIDVLCGKTCIRRYLNPEETYREEEDVDDETLKARIAVTNSLKGLVGSLNRLLAYYLDNHEDEKIESISLIGLGADFSGLSKLLTNELNQKVKVYRGDEDSKISKTVHDENMSVSAYVACIGAGMAPLNILPAEQAKAAKGGSKLSQKSVDATTAGVLVFVVCAVVAIGLAGTTLIGYFNAKSKVEKTEAHIAELEAQGLDTIYSDYIQATMLSSTLKETYAATLSRSEDLVEFIEELEEKMPSSIVIMNFYATPQNVSMSMTVDSKEAVAKTLLQLATFESIDVVNTSGLTESVGETGESTVSFSVDLVYKAIGAEATEAVETEEAEEAGVVQQTIEKTQETLDALSEVEGN